MRFAAQSRERSRQSAVRHKAAAQLGARAVQRDQRETSGSTPSTQARVSAEVAPCSWGATHHEQHVAAELGHGGEGCALGWVGEVLSSDKTLGEGACWCKCCSV